MKRRKHSQPEESFQMAPMIDMVFLLLVFFMTVGTLARDARPPLDLAESDTVAKPEQQVPRSVLTLSGDRENPVLFIGPTPAEAEAVEEALRQSLERDPEAEWELRVAADSPYGLTQDWMERCAEAGIVNLHFSVFEQ